MHPWYNTTRELLFRSICRHRQGPAPNILLYCSRRGGSTWVLDTLSANPGMRSVGRPFWTLPHTRHRHRLPNLNSAAGDTSGHQFHQIVHFEGLDEMRFAVLADQLIRGEIEVYPSLNFRAPFFNRVTN